MPSRASLRGDWHSWKEACAIASKQPPSQHRLAMQRRPRAWSIEFLTEVVPGITTSRALTWSSH